MIEAKPAAERQPGWRGRPAALRALYAGALLVLGLVAWARLNDLSLTTASRVVVLISAALLVMSIAGAPAHLLSPSSVFLVVLFVFHFGLLVLTAVGINPLETGVLGPVPWFVDTSQMVEAILLAGAGFVAAAFGLSVAHGARRVPHLPAAWTTQRTWAFSEVGTLVGNALVVSFVAGWFALGLRRGGFDVYLSSYEEFRTATEDFVLPFVYFGIAAGLLLMAASGWDRRHLAGLAAFGVFAAAALAVGVRTETLLPLAAAVAVFAKAGRPPRARVVIAVILVGMSLVAAVRTVRQSGLTETVPGAVSVNPLDALAELGSGLRPVLVVLEWREDGEPYLLGASYWAPVERQLALFLPGLDRPPAAEDDRLLNIVVGDRVGAIGFSIIAEAHRNFGPPGVMVILALFGYLVGMFDRWRPSPLANLVVGFGLLHLLRHVRNSFTPIPVEILLSVLVLAVVWSVAWAVARHQPPAEEGPAPA